MKAMEMIKTVLNNKYVLYAVLVIAILNIIGYLAVKDVDSVVFFLLVGLISSNFSKNMIVILLSAIVATNLFLGSRHVYRNSRGEVEGFEGEKDKEKDKETDHDVKSEKGDEDKSEDKDKSGSQTKGAKAKDSKAAAAAADPAGAMLAAVNNTSNNDKNDKNDKKSEKAAEKAESSSDDTHKKDAKAKKQGMSNLMPAKYNDTGDEEDVHSVNNTDGTRASKDKKRVDYAQTLEQAYDNLQNIIGNDGVRGLTDQTKSLMEQQQQLMKNMKDMEPLLNTAQGFMNQLTGSGGLASIAKLFSNSSSGAKQAE